MCSAPDRVLLDGLDLDVAISVFVLSVTPQLVNVVMKMVIYRYTAQRNKYTLHVC